jgi:hypothetical protein
LSVLTGARRSALRSGEVGSASRRPGFFSVWTVVRIVVLAAALTVLPLNEFSSPKGLCEEFRRETMAMFVEQVTAKTAATGAGRRAPGSFETSMLDEVLAMDCNGQETSSP